ncbi:unnamed protein product [Pedinophyceae sp. YPF-701]|nr:unnamed protein product [Pedinophyceae sp. YPF-701]
MASCARLTGLPTRPRTRSLLHSRQRSRSALRRIHIRLVDEATYNLMVEDGKGSQELAGVHDFAAGLAHNTVLRMLALDEFTGFAEPGGFVALADALRTNTALRSLSIKEAEFSRDCGGAMHVLVQALRHNRGLRCIELGYGSDTGDDAKRMMVQALRENTTLQRLCVGRLLREETRVYGLSFGDSIENVDGPFPRIVLHDTP